MRKFVWLVTLLLNASVGAFAVANDCTIYASPAGGGGGGTSGAPTTITGANSASAAGDVICLEHGTYSVAATIHLHSGTSSQHLKWEPYGDGAVIVTYTGPFGAAGERNLFAGADYLDMIGPMEWTDSSQNLQAVMSQGGNKHTLVSYMYIHGIAGGGLSAASGADYIHWDHNVLFHIGYDPNHNLTTHDGIGNAMSLNSPIAADSYTGIHNVISNNICAGDYDPSTFTRTDGTHTDGGCMIFDLSTVTASAFPPSLVINNVCYGNAGRCLHQNNSAQGNIYWINNTTYKPGLDPKDCGGGGCPSVQVEGGPIYLANNLVVALGTNGCSFNGSTCLYSYKIVNGGSIQWFKNFWYGGAGNTGGTFPGTGVINNDPQYVAPPTETSGGWSVTADPGANGSLLGNKLQLQAGSPAIGAGIDPSDIAGLPGQIATDLRSYVYTDILGVSRGSHGAYIGDLGAYQSATGGSPPATPTGLTATPH